jgi:mycofactocin precursor
LITDTHYTSLWWSGILLPETQYGILVIPECSVNFAPNKSEVYQMAEISPLINQNASPDVSTPTDPEVSEIPTDADLEEELEELVIEDFTIDGICGVY